MSRLSKSVFLSLFWAIAFISATTQARRLSNNRFSSRIEAEDNVEGEVAVVREVYPTRYPAAGYRPGRAFNLPTEGDYVSDDEQEEGSGLTTTTTELPADLYTTTTEANEVETTTPYNWVAAELASDDDAKQGRSAKAPYPPSGWRPNRAFLLPTEEKAARDAAAAEAEAEEDSTTQNDSDVVDAITTSTATPLAPFTTRLPYYDDVTQVNEADEADEAAAAAAVPTTPQPQDSERRKAPYPPSGWRPSRAFLLPTEIKAANQKSVESAKEPESPVSSADKAGHPACGVSDNPMSPKPAEDAKDNPDAERVYVTANLGPAVVGAPLTVPVLPRSQRLITPPIYVPAGRSFAYSTIVQSWR